MIITQTPLRISFFGGGTDFPEFYLKHSGLVLSSAIDRYIFVIIKQRFDEMIRIGYTRTELVDHVDSVQHDLVRECLRRTGIDSRIEIATMGDIASSGSGLGSSSAVTVGLLTAMYQYLGRPQNPRTLAQEACDVELNALGRPMGIQDQYIAAFGGQRRFSFGTDGQVGVEELPIEEADWHRLNDCLMLFYTKITRQAETVLAEQRRNIDDRIEELSEIRDLAEQASRCLECGCLDDFGRLLDRGWRLKRKLASRITNPLIDDAYRAAKKAGALGGKVAGAGGGGYLLLYCRPERQDAVRAALKAFPEMPFNLERAGTKVIFDYSRVTTRPIATERWSRARRAAAGD